MLKIISRKIELDDTADRWELFDMEGRELVAQHINRVIESAVNTGSNREQVRANAYVVMQMYREYGANDTEGHRRLEDILEKIFVLTRD